MLLVAAHSSRHRVLTDALDPSITDETDPTKRLVELDLFDPANPNQVPFSAEYITRFRAAQEARNRRITAWVLDTLASIRAAGRPHDERGFVVHGTMADPRNFDGALDPNERALGMSFIGDPQIANMGPIGLARFCTLRSWLSQWSTEYARADGITCAARISVPTMVVYNLADDVCYPSHGIAMFDAVGHDDKELVAVPGATHYYAGPDQRGPLNVALGKVTDWLERHDFGGE
ncbi:MAG: acetylxylan esterase [Ilumatobacteraceae bacterium]